MIATDLGTITTIQEFEFSFRKPGSFHVFFVNYGIPQEPWISLKSKLAYGLGLIIGQVGPGQ